MLCKCSYEVLTCGKHHEYNLMWSTTPDRSDLVQDSVLCFAGWLSESTASHTAQDNTLWCIFTTKYAFSYCVVCSLHTLCSLQPDNQPAKHNISCTVLCKLVVSLRMQKRKTTDKIYEISIVPNLPNYSIVVFSWPESFAFCN